MRRRAEQPQLVRERLGDRFLPWQMEQSVEESWAECEHHARNILGEDGYRRLMAELQGTPESPAAPTPPTATNSPPPDGHPTDLFGNPLPTDLFGNVIEPKQRKRK